MLDTQSFGVSLENCQFPHVLEAVDSRSTVPFSLQLISENELRVSQKSRKTVLPQVYSGFKPSLAGHNQETILSF